MKDYLVEQNFEMEGHNFHVAIQRGWKPDLTLQNWQDGSVPKFRLGNKHAELVVCTEGITSWSVYDLEDGKEKNHRSYATLTEVLDVETIRVGGKPFDKSKVWSAPRSTLNYDY